MTKHSEGATATSLTAAKQIAAIADRHRLDQAFRPRVLAETMSWVRAPGIDDETLDDLSRLPFVTIDNASSRDLDQALFIGRHPRGYSVRYAVADASHFVRPGSALFAEALRRGATYYLPGLAITMLPRALSEGVVSLNCGVARRAVVFTMLLDRAGRCQRSEIACARIRSVAKLSFQRVQRFFNDPCGSDLAATEFADSLQLLAEVGRLLMAAARDHKVVDYQRTELELKLDGDHPSGFAIAARERLEVERCNEQISLLCNVEAARALEANHRLDWVQAVFRVHPPPLPERRSQLAAQLATLVELRSLDPGRWLWREDRGQPLAELLRGLPTTGPQAALTRAVMRQALLSNQRSVFAEQPGGHFGVGAPVYARASAPMREIVGVFTHKELLESLGPAASAPPASRDLVLRERVVAAGNRAKALQRQLDKEIHALVLDTLFRGELARGEGERSWWRGTVLGMKPSHVYVELDRFPVEVKLYRRDLETLLRAELAADDQLVALRRADTGEVVLCLGDRVELRAATRDPTTDRWSFRLVHVPCSPPAP